MKHLLSILTAVFAVLAFLVSCGGSEGSGSGGSEYSGGNGSGGIYGHVTDFATGEDVANANVQLRPSGETTLTGSDGMFEFRDLTPGNYSLTVSKVEYSDLIDDYVITVKDKMVKRDIQLEKKKAEVAMLDILDNAGNPITELDFGTELISRQFQIYNAGPKTIDCTIITEGYSAEWVTSVSLQSPLTVKIEPGAAYGAVATIDRSKLSIGQNTTSMQVTTSNGNKELIIKATEADSCKNNPCGEHGICESIGVKNYDCKCDDETYFDGSKCNTFSECSTTSNTPCKDSSTGLVWSGISSENIGLTGMSTYCNYLNEGNLNWHIPNIDELRSLINGCSNTAIGGFCEVSATNGCLSMEECWSQDTCGNCGTTNAPTISKFGDSKVLWSSSVVTSESINDRWIVNFSIGEVYSSEEYDYRWNYIRCVR